MNQDELQKIDDARRARVLLQGLLAERKEVIVSHMVSDYRADKLVYEKLVGWIGEIAGMEAQIDKLTRRIRGAD